jgi:hypothetical protein
MIIKPMQIPMGGKRSTRFPLLRAWIMRAPAPAR